MPTSSRHHVRPTRDQLRESLCRQAAELRQTADEMVAMLGGCDDPLDPFTNVIEKQKHYTTWREFADRVCRPIVEFESRDCPELQAALKLFRAENPHYIATCLVFALNTALAYDEARTKVV